MTQVMNGTIRIRVLDAFAGLKSMLAVEFEGEAGLGNGVRREWFQVSLVARDNACLASTTNARAFSCSEMALRG
jgi:hypothetical protein